MANYSTDANLIGIRPKCLSFGITDATTYHARAKVIIDRIIEQKWYRPEATDRGYIFEDTPFAADQLEPTQMVYLSSYKTLELLYMALMKTAPEADGFERLAGIYREEFDKELQSLLSLGITYDWDDDDSYSEAERISTQRRRLKKT